MTSSPFVSTAWLADRLEDPDLVVIDASWYLPAMNRDAAKEYAAAHIPGAVRFDIDTVKDKNSPLPHMLPSGEQFSAEVGAMGIGDGMTIVVYDGAGLFAAPRVWWTFKAFGAKQVHLLEGGFPQWQAEGRPTESGPPRPRPQRRFTASPKAASVASADDVRQALEKKTAQVLDARPADRFAGDAPEPRAGVRSGHMPGSLNLPFAHLIENGRLKDPQTLTKSFEQAGLDLERPVITSCGSGVSAAILAVALETVGHPIQALYDGSFAEWGARDDLPIATGPAK